jgi:hypothetical protein
MPLSFQSRPKTSSGPISRVSPETRSHSAIPRESTTTLAPWSAGYIYRDGVEIGRAPIRGLRGISGSRAFSALATVDSSGRRDCLSIASVGRRRPNLKDLANRMSVDPTFLANARKLITRGTSLIVTNAPVNARTRSSSGFNIVTSW